MKLGTSVRKLRLSENSLVLIKQGTSLSNMDALEDLAKTIGETRIKNVILVVVDSFDDVETLNEVEMNKRGWFHSDALARMIHANPTDNGKEEDKNEPS